MSMLIEKIYYCPVGNIVHDAYGKEYPIKKDRRWLYINIDNQKIGLSKISQKIRIRDFDDFVHLYIFLGWHSKYPCPAMDSLVNKKLKQYGITQ